MSSPEKTFQTSNVLLLSFSHFIHDIYTSFLAPALPLIIEKLSITLSQAGLLSTVMQLPSLFNPLIGSLIDGRGLARWVIVLAPSMTAVPMCLIGMASSYWTLLLLFFITGISVAMYHVPAPGVIAAVSGTKKGRGMSFYMTGGEAARMLGPLIAVAVVSMGGLSGFYPMMIAALVTSAMLHLKLPPARTNSGGSTAKSSLAATTKEMRHLLTPLAGILTARAFMHSAMGVFLPVFIEQETGNLWLAGSSLALYEAFGVAGVLSAGTLSDAWGRKRILSAAVMVAPAGLLLFIVTSGFLKVLMLCLTGFSILSTTPVMLAMVQEQTKGAPSAANGLFMMISFLTRSLAIVLVGGIADLTSLSTMYLICAAMGLLALPFLRQLKDPASTS